jgi:hypothetical protein
MDCRSAILPGRLIAVATMTLLGACMHEPVSPAGPRPLVREATVRSGLPSPHLESVPSETGSEMLPCTAQSWACVSATITRPGEWISRGGTWLQAEPGTAAYMSTAGVSKIFRANNTYAGFDAFTHVCFAVRTCPDEVSHVSTCEEEMNYVSFKTNHSIALYVTTMYPSITNKSTWNMCAEPNEYGCGGGGGDDDDDEDYTGPPPSTNQTATGQRATFSCGGDGGPDLVCHTEYLRLEISYDDGATWVVLWEGYGEVCDLAM